MGGTHDGHGEDDHRAVVPPDLLADAEIAETIRSWLNDAELPPAPHRLIVEGLADMERALRAQARDRTAGQADRRHWDASSRHSVAGGRYHRLGEASQLLAFVAFAGPEDEGVGAVVDDETRQFVRPLVGRAAQEPLGPRRR